MSRNLMETDCYYCEGPVKLDEAPRLITKQDAGVYFGEFAGTMVANASCPACEAQYLAWVHPCEEHRRRQLWVDPDTTHYDLSFRSTFNDEPGPDDLPKWDVEWQPVRLRPYVPNLSICKHCKAGAMYRGSNGESRCSVCSR